MAAELILPRLFPDAEKIRAEVSVGNSRFDFLVEKSTGSTLVEVKACTLVEYGTAMFPDAPTSRGRRHVEELAGLSARDGMSGMVLFVVANPDAERLVPGLHTDPAFAAALIRASSTTEIRAVSTECDADGWVKVVTMRLPVDLEAARPALVDCGIYLLRATLESPALISVGALGKIRFPAGEYLYAGSAKKGVAARTARHLRRRKTHRWHIDYLTARANRLEAVPIRTARELECAFAGDLRLLCGEGIPGFGASDCDCRSHLFRLPPERKGELERLILRYRHRDALE